MSHSPDPKNAANSDDEVVHATHADAHDEPVPEEPKTPLWLTALGGGLFFLLAVGWLAGLASEPSAEAAAASPSAAVATAAPPVPPKPSAPPALPPPAPPPIAAPPAPIPPPPPPIAPVGAAKATKKPAK